MVSGSWGSSFLAFVSFINALHDSLARQDPIHESGCVVDSAVDAQKVAI